MFFSRVFGRPLSLLFGRTYGRIYLRRVSRKARGLRIRLVGGIVDRGWTSNDVDVLGDMGDAITFSRRLSMSGIGNPVHFCGAIGSHSHFACLWSGLKLVVLGKGI